MAGYQKQVPLARSFLVFFLLAAYAGTASSTLLFSDDFESGTGNWSNVAVGDNKNWTRDSGGTPSSGTGPATGANGSLFYMYLETSSGSAYTAGDTAILQGPDITHTNVQLSFKYHMYGSNIGTLAVDVLSGDTWINDVWSNFGQQNTSHSSAYVSANVDLGSYSVSRIRFRATAAGGYCGDIAVDDIQISGEIPGPVAPLFTNNPFTKAEARQDQAYSDSIANDASDANGDTLFFSKISGPAWLFVAADGVLSGTPSSVDVGLNSFVVEVSDGSFSDSATLEITVLDNTVPIILSSSDFESGTGDWNNVTVGDNKNWTRDSGGTPSSGTGPNSGADGSLYYMYLETSSGSAYSSGDSAILQGPEVSGSNMHLKFQYHMYGANSGTLAVDVLSGGAWANDVWSIPGQQQSGNGSAYNAVDVDLSSYSVSRVRFRATAAGGYTGDIAIDNLELYIPAEVTLPAAPFFLSDPVVKASAIVNLPYSNSIEDDATDANGDVLVFSKISGPAWLSVAADGALSGTPSSSDLGNNNFVVSVSDGSLSNTATLSISVLDSALSASVYPATAGHGQDGGANFGWAVDGVIDEFWVRTAYQDDVVVRRYTSLDFTKRSHFWGVYEFRFPQTVIDNAANIVIDSASLELDIDGAASGLINLHGYLGNGSVELSDFTNNNLITGVSPAANRITVDVTAFLNSMLGQSNHIGFLLKPWDINSDMYIAMWNGTPHPAFGHISGQISRLVINYRVQ